MFANFVVLTPNNREMCFTFTTISDGVPENTETLTLVMQPVEGLTADAVSIINSRQKAQVFISKRML